MQLISAPETMAMATWLHFSPRAPQSSLWSMHSRIVLSSGWVAHLLYWLRICTVLRSVQRQIFLIRIRIRNRTRREYLVYHLHLKYVSFFYCDFALAGSLVSPEWTVLLALVGAAAWSSWLGRGCDVKQQQVIFTFGSSFPAHKPPAEHMLLEGCHGSSINGSKRTCAICCGAGTRTYLPRMYVKSCDGGVIISRCFQIQVQLSSWHLSSYVVCLSLCVRCGWCFE